MLDTFLFFLFFFFNDTATTELYTLSLHDALPISLNRVSQVTGKSIYNQWALELAKVAHAAFCYTPTWGGGKRMYWKMSIDLSRPQVDSMGQHDPLDGLITCLQLAATAKGFPETPAELNLDIEIEDLTAMCAGGN